MQQYVHLHLHTEYSLLDGATRISPLIAKAKELNMPAVAITDHGNMYCAWHFYHEAIEKGIKPIIGCEFYVCSNLNERSGENREFNHLVLLAKNNKGYKNLVKLNSIAFVDGFYYKPRIDQKTLFEHSEGLVCMSACIAGRLPQLIIHDRLREADELVSSYKQVFGEDYYIELQNHGIEEELSSMPELIKLAHRHNVKMVATNDVHYLEKKDSDMHDVMLCVQTNRKYSDPTRMRFTGDCFYLKTYDEMLDLFPNMPELLSNTLEIANKCNVSLSKSELLPAYTTPDGSTAEQFLRKLITEGRERKYPNASQEVLDRIEYEYGIVVSMGYVDYFLIVYDFINYAKRNGIPVGPGRGSGAGSVIAYLIGITEVEPFKYGLMFERFLNPNRKTMPDFDIDFCMDRRGEVIEYVRNLYGPDNVVQIVTFGTMASKNAIRDVCRVLDFTPAIAKKIAGYVPQGFKYTLSHLLGFTKYRKEGDKVISQELIDLYNDPTYHKLIDYAMKLDGSPRQTGMHAAGVIICRDAISDHVPLQTNGGAFINGGIVTTQYNMKEVEEAGLLKMDFLGLRTLTDIKKAIDYVKISKGIDVSFEHCNYDDKNVFKQISSGDTMGIFQLESGGMTQLMKRLQVDNLEEIIAGISLYRPGPMDFIDQYIDGKFNPAGIVYLHPTLEPILKLTNGCIVYQEQVMEIVKVLGGFSIALADNVRYAMSKKKYDMMTELGRLFISGGLDPHTKESVPGCAGNGIPREVATTIFNNLIKFSSYAFNKSHAACYAYVAYQTAYLKTYHPVELLCAMLNNRITNIDNIKKYIRYARSRGIKILPPCINNSRENFTVEDGGIRFGLGGIKGIGVDVVSRIVEERDNNGKFTTIVDLFSRTLSTMKKSMVLGLIKCGAFDCFNRTRCDMVSRYEEVFDKVKGYNKSKSSGQMSIFGDEDITMYDDYSNTKCYPEYPQEELFNLEKDAIGFFLTGSPLDNYEDVASQFGVNFDTSLLPSDSEEDEGEVVHNIANLEHKKVTMCGILSDSKVIKRDKTMYFAKLEDINGSIEVAVYDRAYAKYQELIEDDKLLVVSGTLRMGRDTINLTVDKIVDPAKAKPTHEKKVVATNNPPRLYIKVDNLDEDTLDDIIEMLKAYSGDCPCYLVNNGKKFPVDYKARHCPGIINEFELMFGEGKAVFVES